jgi:hypothetical protein
VFHFSDNTGQAVNKVFNPAIFTGWSASYLTCQRPINHGLCLDFSGAVTDFCLSGFSPIVDDKGPSPANLDIDGPSNFE